MRLEDEHRYDPRHLADRDRLIARLRQEVVRLNNELKAARDRAESGGEP
jgi:hypothetical protein